MYQKVVLVGNLGNSPELRYLPDGSPVCSFSLATNRRWTGRDGQPAQETTWFKISVWGSQAEACNQYLTKGRQVLVDGQLTPDKQTGGPRLWEGNDGLPRASYEVRAFTVQFLGGGNAAPARAEADEPEAGQIDEDQIPF